MLSLEANYSQMPTGREYRDRKDTGWQPKAAGPPFYHGQVRIASNRVFVEGTEKVFCTGI